MSIASKLHGEKQSLPFLRLIGLAVIGTAVRAAALTIMMGRGPSSETLGRYAWERVGKMFVYVEPATWPKPLPRTNASPAAEEGGEGPDGEEG